MESFEETPEEQVLRLIRIDTWIADYDPGKVRKELDKTEHQCVLHPGLTVTALVNRQYFDPADPDITALQPGILFGGSLIDLELLHAAAHSVRTLRTEFTTDDGIRVQCELGRASWEVIGDGLRDKKFKQEHPPMTDEEFETALK